MQVKISKDYRVIPENLKGEKVENLREMETYLLNTKGIQEVIENDNNV